MTYTKPEIAILGTATSVIELFLHKPYLNEIDFILGLTPAYDLDE